MLLVMNLRSGFFGWFLLVGSKFYFCVSVSIWLSFISVFAVKYSSRTPVIRVVLFLRLELRWGWRSVNIFCRLGRLSVNCRASFTGYLLLQDLVKKSFIWSVVSGYSLFWEIIREIVIQSSCSILSCAFSFFVRLIWIFSGSSLSDESYSVELPASLGSLCLCAWEGSETTLEGVRGLLFPVISNRGGALNVDELLSYHLALRVLLSVWL